MIIGEDFRILEHNEKESTLPIELLLSPFKGVIFKYNTVSVKEDADGGTAKIIFSYDLIEMGDHIETTLRKDERFNDVLGLILNRMILETVDVGELDDRKNDSEEFTEE
tara:strand:- start:15114 stop:15440 length:327 start_codon:yes stop_codon:yes gene_type:complete